MFQHRMAVLQVLAGPAPSLHFTLFVKRFGKLSTEKHCQNASLLFLQRGITGSAVGSPCEQVPKSCWEMLMELAGWLQQPGGAGGSARRAAAPSRLLSTAGSGTSRPAIGKVSKPETGAQHPGVWMNLGLSLRFGAQLRSKLREPSACCLPRRRALLPSPPPRLNCLRRAELTPLLHGRVGTWGQSGKLGRVLLCWISWLLGSSPWGRWLLLVGCTGCCQALTAGSSSAAGLEGSQ